jgi:hypothetical protein
MHSLDCSSKVLSECMHLPEHIWRIVASWVGDFPLEDARPGNGDYVVLQHLDIMLNFRAPEHDLMLFRNSLRSSDTTSGARSRNSRCARNEPLPRDNKTQITFCWKANNKENHTKSENIKNQHGRIYYEIKGMKPPNERWLCT